MLNKEQEKELIDNLIRDITRVDFMTKSEARRRINKLLKSQRERLRDEKFSDIDFKGTREAIIKEAKQEERENMIKVIEGNLDIFLEDTSVGWLNNTMTRKEFRASFKKYIIKALKDER